MRLRGHAIKPLARPVPHRLNVSHGGEHHRHPRIPCRNRPALARYLEEQGQGVERLSSSLAMLAARQRAAR